MPAMDLYFQNKRLDDFGAADKEGLYRFLDAKFDAIDRRFARIEERLDKLEAGAKAEKQTSPG